MNVKERIYEQYERMKNSTRGREREANTDT